MANLQSPAAKAKRGASAKRAWADPEFRAKHKRAMDAFHADGRAAKALRLEAARTARTAELAERAARIEKHRRLWAAEQQSGPVDKARRKDFLSAARADDLTFAEIGAICDITKQRAHEILFMRSRRKGEAYPHYRRPRLRLPPGEARPG